MDLLRILADQKAEIERLDIKKLVARKEEKAVDINSKFAQVVIGVRRCGKSTLCQKVLIESKVKFGYINFDDDRFAKLRLDDFDELLSALYQLNGNFSHLFLDEVQNICSWPLFVNRMLRQGMHIILTGSNANLLSNDLSTHLTGRYNEIELFPFSFIEFCEAKKVKLSGYSTRDISLRKNALMNYMKIGGFPEIVEGEAPAHYALHLISTIVKKDVAKRYKVKYEEVLWNLSNSLLETPGAILSPTKLADKLNVKSFHTIENYISYLRNAYLIVTLRKYSSKAIERKLSSKGYSIDMAFINDHEDFYKSEGLGWRLENIVALELLRRIKHAGIGELYYGFKSRVYDVDFVVTHRGRVTQIIQVCYDFSNPSERLYKREVGNLISAAKVIKCDNLMLLVMEGETGEIKYEDYKVKVVDCIEWLLDFS